MKPAILSLPLVALALAGPAIAQNPRPALVSPEVHSDRTVTFRLRAPQAQAVSVSGDWGKEGGALAKDDAGVWSLTVGPLPADTYSYGFTADGVRLLDPANTAAKPMRSKTDSVLVVPGGEPAAWDRRPGVPRGTVHLHDYTSASLGRERRVRVYTPPNYDADPAARFPVLYLLHGSGDNEATWTEFGLANVILDNLIAAGKSTPMVVVTPDGHAAKPSGQPGRRDFLADFEADLLGDVVPLVEGRYRVRAERGSRAVAGLSMGGNQSLVVGLNHTDLFAWVGGMSSAMREPERTLAPFLKDPAANGAKLNLLWVACGKDDRLVKENREFHDLLTAKGVPHVWRETDGAHKWGVWRRYLAELAPLLFVPAADPAKPQPKAS